MGRTPVRLAVVVAALLLAAPAIAYVCHPDPAGTRSRSLHGRVAAYSLRGSTLTVALRSSASCRVFVWRAREDRLAPSNAACSSVVVRRRPSAGAARVRVLYAGAADRPDRLRVLGQGGRNTHTWPLPVRVRPGTMQVSGRLASYMARGGNGLWVTGLRSGRTTFVAPVRLGDHPLLDASGVAYQDNVYKHAPAGRTLLKFVPTRGLEQELAAVGRPLHTSGPIRSFSVDETRVALVVAGRGGCDRVVLWHIPWRSAEQVSQKSGPTCAPGSASGRISKVALAGNRAEWLTLHRDRVMLVAADAVGCQEWVIRRLSDLGSRISLGGIAGDGQTLAFALVDRSAALPVSTVGRVTGAYRGRDLRRVSGSVRAVSADGSRIATLASGGAIDVTTDRGFHVRTIVAKGTAALAVRRHLVVGITRDGHLDVFSTSTGRRLHRWTVPAGARNVDLQYGIAVVASGRSVYAIDVATGRIARLAVAPGRVRAQIGSVGVVYAYSSNGRGTVKVVPMSRVEAAVR